MNDPTETRMNTGAATPSTRSPVPSAMSTPSTRSEARSTAAAQGRSRAGQTDQSSVSGASDARTPPSPVATLGLEVPPGQRQLPGRACLVQTPHRRLRRRLLHPLGILPGLPIDREQDLGERVQTRLGLRLGGLD